MVFMSMSRCFILCVTILGNIFFSINDLISLICWLIGILSGCIMPDTDYGKWTLVRLKAELRKRGAKSSGKKADLVKRYVYSLIQVYTSMKMELLVESTISYTTYAL